MEQYTQSKITNIYNLSDVISKVSPLKTRMGMIQSPFSNSSLFRNNYRNLFGSIAYAFSGYSSGILSYKSAYDTLIELAGSKKLKSIYKDTDSLSDRLKSADLKFKNYDLVPVEDEEKENAQQEESSIIIFDEALRLKSVIEQIHRDQAEMYRLTPGLFEEVIAELLKKKNFEVQLTKKTRDGGYDIIAIQDLGGFRNKYLVECKRNSKDRPVGINIVRSFMDVITTNNVNKGIICTTSYFSPECYKRQNEAFYLLELKDKAHIIDWVNDYVTK